MSRPRKRASSSTWLAEARLRLVRSWTRWLLSTATRREARLLRKVQLQQELTDLLLLQLKEHQQRTLQLVHRQEELRESREFRVAQLPAPVPKQVPPPPKKPPPLKPVLTPEQVQELARRLGPQSRPPSSPSSEMSATPSPSE